jgi:hypothetical protein
MPDLQFYASQPHYARHLEDTAALFGCEVQRGVHRPKEGTPVVIAGMGDIDYVPRRTPVALLAHGAGQMYQGLDHRSWDGGMGREKVSLFLVPRDECGEANVRRYPDASYATVGCPALDRYAGRVPLNPEPVVAFTFHPAYPAARACRELDSALPHYLDALPEIVGKLQAEGVRVVGHRHPRFRSLKNLWRKLEVEFVESWPDLIGEVDCLVADNTSALPESAAVGAGTVWLTHPKWRRDVHHGGRFWEWPSMGTQADGPQEVVSAVLTELSRPWPRSQQEAIRDVYGGVPLGSAAELAAEAVREWAET